MSKSTQFFNGITSRTISGTVYCFAVASGTGGNDIYLATGTCTSWSVAKVTPASPYGITIGSNGYVFASGSAGQVYISTASPYSTWTAVTTSSSVYLEDISSYDGVNVIAVGDYGVVYYSSNSGTTWTNAGINSSYDLFGVSHGNSTFAMACGSYSFVGKTYDGGATWVKMSVLSANNVDIRFKSISLLSNLIAYVASGSDGAIYQTLNAGISWTNIATTGVGLRCISMYDTIRGVAGSTGSIYALVPGMPISFNDHIIYPKFLFF